MRSIGGGLVVARGDAAALAHAIDQVLDNQKAWRTEAGGAATRVRLNYGTDIVCAKLEQVYAEVMAAVS